MTHWTIELRGPTEYLLNLRMVNPHQSLIITQPSLRAARAAAPLGITGLSQLSWTTARSAVVHEIVDLLADHLLIRSTTYQGTLASVMDVIWLVR